ncbi:MAG TPA: class I SAM-dependent methyltransferase [Acidimicrobiales bacterium]|nr:class I SAM-dependent methyltransferase [Acidimicrobiales bacterium]
MAPTRFSPGGSDGAAPASDVLQYGPGLPPESELKLLGHVDGRRILDLGCGAGAGSVALAKAGARVIAVDEDAANVGTTRDNAEREGVRVETHHGPLPELAFVRADTIDAAVSVYGLAAADDLDRIFRQVHRVLRPERPLVFSLPHPAFTLLDPDGGEPVLRRTWWDPSPVAWSVAAGGTEPDRAHTLSGLFASLGRANFRVDALAEPEPDRAACPDDSWSDAMRWVPPTLIVRARKVA